MVLAPPEIKALLFDLDGTLLDIDFRSFLDEYATTVAQRFADVAPVDVFKRQLFLSTRAMIFNDKPGRTTLQAFLDDFTAALPLPDDAVSRFVDYYLTEFPRLRKWSRPSPGGRELVEAGLRRGLLVVLATAPFFPEIAVRERLRWAGLGDTPFHFITSSDKMTRSKPFPEFFLEVASHIGVAPEHCLMVGDETVMDGAAVKAGMQVALIGPEKPSYSDPWLDKALLEESARLNLPRYPDLPALHRELAARGVL